MYIFDIIRFRLFRNLKFKIRNYFFMSPHTFVFVGRSGCGKGTQAGLLMQYMKEKFPDEPIFYLETGQKFRDFTNSEGYTNSLAKKIQEKGGLQPAFLAVWMWAHIFVEKLVGNENLFIDGTPRKLGEAIIFTESMKFYGRKPYIVFLNVSRKWSEERLRERQRTDDMSEIIKSRLDWFDTEVAPAIEYFKTNPDVTFLDINGERSIQDIQDDILGRLKI